MKRIEKIEFAIFVSAITTIIWFIYFYLMIGMISRYYDQQINEYKQQIEVSEKRQRYDY